MDVAEVLEGRQAFVDDELDTGGRQPPEDVLKETDHALWLCRVLKAEREKRKWSLQTTADAIAREAGRESLSKQSLTKWEDAETQPKMDDFAAWARALGFKLEVDLVIPEEQAVSVRVPEEVAHACRQLATLDPVDRQLVVAVISRLQRRIN